MRLAREIAETRGPELCRAHGNLVMLAAGYKRTHSPETGAHTQMHKQACVIFVVRRKWSAGHAPKHARAVPTHLFAYTTLDSKRVMCAVPTDVVPADGYHTGRAQAASGVFAIMPGYYAQFGNATCAVLLTRPGFQSETFMLCCQHVLSPELQFEEDPPLKNIAVYNLAAMRAAESLERLRAGVVPAGLQSMGSSVAYGGRMRLSPRSSFDAQLARIDPRAGLRRALNGLRLSPTTPAVENQDAFDALHGSNNFEILVSPENPLAEAWQVGNRDPIRAEFSGYLGLADELEYEQPRDTVHICHFLLIELRILDAQRTYRGDSGSPVVMQAGDGRHTLVGMHIAGGERDGEYYSFVLPAWQLFDAENYPNLPDGAELRPIDVS